MKGAVDFLAVLIIGLFVARTLTVLFSGPAVDNDEWREVGSPYPSLVVYCDAWNNRVYEYTDLMWGKSIDVVKKDCRGSDK